MSKVYTEEQVKTAATEYFNGDELAGSVFLKYALRNNEDEYLELTPTDMHRRLAKEFARIEAKYPNPMSEDEIFGLLSDWRVVPQGSPMSGIGNPYQLQSLSNCFVTQTGDSYGSILRADEHLAQIMKRRGGAGLSLSTIRPAGMPTSNAARTTAGIGPYMERFSNTTREVGQGGRRGALMQTLSIHHPEVETFINIKRDLTKVTGANVSLQVTDEFMRAVEAGEDYEQRFPVEGTPKFTKTESAQKIFSQMAEAAHSSAEPAPLFWDTVLRYSPADCYAKFGYTTISTNPCGELPLSYLDSCRLMVLNLTQFVKGRFLESASFNYKEFREVAIKAQRLMDDMIDLELEQIDKIIAKVISDPEEEDVKATELKLWQDVRNACENGRRTGLGITGLGDALAMLDIRYGSDESIKETEEIYRALALASYSSSVTLAEERGSFSVFDHKLEKGHPFLQRIWDADPDLYKRYLKHGRRNIANLTTAPAGSVSTLTQTTSGIEPAFLLKYTRRKKINSSEENAQVDFVDALGDRWQEFEVYHHGFEQWMDITGETDPEKSPYWKGTSADIDWVAGVDLQGAAQRWVDHAISKTVNLPKDATIETVEEVFMRAWKVGCKGITVYRDGTRDGVLISDAKKEADAAFKTHNAPKRPETLLCDIHQTSIKGEKWTILVGLMDGRPYEVFGGLSQYVEISRKHKSGSIKKRKVRSRSVYDLEAGEDDASLAVRDIVNVFENPTHGAFTRTLSLSLRHGAPVQFVVEQLQKDEKDSDMFSFSKVISRVLKNYIVDGTETTKKCAECGVGEMKYQEGCMACIQCGYSKC